MQWPLEAGTGGQRDSPPSLWRAAAFGFSSATLCWTSDSRTVRGRPALFCVPMLCDFLRQQWEAKAGGGGPLLEEFRRNSISILNPGGSGLP